MKWMGVESLSTCLPYHSTATNIQDAINVMATANYDFNGSGTNVGDENHITVERGGDGSVTSGYGYTYTLRFGGPDLEFGQTNVMGGALPTVEIINQGSYDDGTGACKDIEIVGVSAVSVTQTTASRTWTLASGTTAGVLQVGDRIRIDDTTLPTDKYITYTIKALTANTITVDKLMVGTSAGTRSVFKVETPIVEYAVNTVQKGEDSYTYDVFFTGRHVSNMSPLVPVICPVYHAVSAPSGYKQFNGMRYGVTVYAFVLYLVLPK